MGSMARAAAIRTQGRRGRGPERVAGSDGFCSPTVESNEGEVAGSGRRAPASAGASRLVAATRRPGVGERGQRPGHLVRCLEPPRRVLGHHPLDDLGQLRRHVGADLPSGRGVFSLWAISFWIRLPSGNGGRPASRK